MIDPDLKYCPQCEDEYRADIENCAVCKIPLITGRDKIAMREAQQRQLAQRKGALSPDEDIVTIHSASMQDMKHLEELLAVENIGTLVVGDDNSCGKGCCPSTYYLQVRREDAQDAYKIILAEQQRLTALHYHDTAHVDNVFNADAGEATCPACGHTFSTTSTTCPDCGLCFG